MDSIPAELLHGICGFLPRGTNQSAVANFRLVCKSFAAVGIEYVLPTVYFVFLPESLSRLAQIAEHPILSRHVIELVYFTDMLPQYSTFEDWKRYAEGPPIATKPWLTTPVQADAWKDYQEIINQQENLRQTGEDYRVVAQVLSKFSNLKTVLLSKNDNWNVAPGDAQCIEPYQRSMVSHMDKPILPDDPCARECRHLASLLTAMNSIQSCPRELRMVDLNWQFFRRVQFPEFNRALRSLEEIYLEITALDLDNWEYDRRALFDLCKAILSGGGIGEFIALAPNLETLELIVDAETPNIINDYAETSGLYLVDLSSIFQDRTFTCLHRLRLEGIEMSDISLIAFFQGHAPTIKDLVLAEVALTGPSSWFDVFVSVPGVLDLEEVELRGRFMQRISPSRDNFLFMDDVAAETDGILIGAALAMVICRNRFTRLVKSGEDRIETYRLEILMDLAEAPPLIPADQYVDLPKPLHHKTRHAELLRECFALEEGSDR